MSQAQIQRHQEETIQLQQQTEEQLHAQPEEATLQAAPVQQEVRRSAEVQANAQLNEQARQTLPPVTAQQTAPGAPVQEEAPARQTWKERQREKRHAKEAKRICLVESAASYDMAHSLQDLKERRINAERDFTPQRVHSSADPRILAAFVQGYKKDRHGNPATPEDAAAKQADDKFIADYCSDKLELRRPHLEQMVDELLDFQFTPEIFSERYMRTHITQLKLIADRGCYIENVMKDPINKPFFDQMEPTRRALLERGFRGDIYSKMGMALANISMGRYGLSINELDYSRPGDGTTVSYSSIDKQRHLENIAQFRGMVEISQTMYNQSLEGYAEQQRAYQETRARQTAESAGDYAARYRAMNAALERAKADSSVKLGSNEASSQYVTRTAFLLKTGEEHQAENVATLQTCRSIGSLIGSGERPDEALYRRGKELVAPRVQKVLECDVDALATLTDQELILRSAQLNELFMDNMFISDLMKLSHHSLSSRDGKPLTLRDELVGQRELEFTYKVNMLRGLAERARSLAILQHLKNGGTTGPEFFTTKEQASAQSDPEAFARSRLEVGTRTIETQRETFRKRTTPGTPEFAEYFQEMEKQRARSEALRKTGPLFDVGDEVLFQSSTPQMKGIQARLQSSNYRAVGYTPEQLQQMNLPQQIKEPLFRTHTGFLDDDAAQALLTPQQFRQMLEDLGVDPAAPGALEQSRRGLAEYRRVLSARYDMLDRKYGRDVLQMDFREMLLHRGEILRDFGDAQVPLNMATQHPEFLKEDDPEQMLLKKRIEFYSEIGNDLGVMLGNLPTTYPDEQTALTSLEQMKQMAMRSKTISEAAAYLEAHDDAFVHAPDWKQKVRVSGGEGEEGGG